MPRKNNAVSFKSALDLARRELARKAPSHLFWRADAAQLNAAIDKVDTELVQAVVNTIATSGGNSNRSRELRDKLKQELAAQGLNKYACAGVSCAFAYAARKLTVNRQ